jgi:hypothetical protein
MRNTQCHAGFSKRAMAKAVNSKIIKNRSYPPKIIIPKEGVIANMDSNRQPAAAA